MSEDVLKIKLILRAIAPEFEYKINLLYNKNQNLVFK